MLRCVKARKVLVAHPLDGNVFVDVVHELAESLLEAARKFVQLRDLVVLGVQPHQRGRRRLTYDRTLLAEGIKTLEVCAGIRSTLSTEILMFSSVSWRTDVRRRKPLIGLCAQRKGMGFAPCAVYLSVHLQGY